MNEMNEKKPNIRFPKEESGLPARIYYFSPIFIHYIHSINLREDSGRCITPENFESNHNAFKTSNRNHQKTYFI